VALREERVGGRAKVITDEDTYEEVGQTSNHATRKVEKLFYM